MHGSGKWQDKVYADIRGVKFLWKGGVNVRNKSASSSDVSFGRDGRRFTV